MASWTVLEEQTVWISPRAVSFTVVCDACAQVVASDWSQMICRSII